ncbi:hypothetical protein [Streptomyces sp. S.PB5]|uniref:hypothetical protein n=1 Tax=Streptomyces sp. S.PB5 TaxID=3020844 RepID=UPI0025B26995|nr:hypothetical protein [Streptomyces sp. S.PB5]MDN3022396.1 hypothetical protein [Streptomyces sp. S.PB5]
MSAGMQMASGKSEIFEAVLKFMPDWVQITVLALVVLAVLVSWGIKIKRKIDYRRAVRSGQPIHAAAQYGQGRGADFLGAYAPQQAPVQTPVQAPAHAPAQGQPSGADFLGAYASQHRQGNGSV